MDGADDEGDADAKDLCSAVKDFESLLDLSRVFILKSVRNNNVQLENFARAVGVIWHTLEDLLWDDSAANENRGGANECLDSEDDANNTGEDKDNGAALRESFNRLEGCFYWVIWDEAHSLKSIKTRAYGVQVHCTAQGRPLHLLDRDANDEPARRPPWPPANCVEVARLT